MQMLLYIVLCNYTKRLYMLVRIYRPWDPPRFFIFCFVWIITRRKLAVSSRMIVTFFSSFQPTYFSFSLHVKWLWWFIILVKNLMWYFSSTIFLPLSTTTRTTLGSLLPGFVYRTAILFNLDCCWFI